MTDNLEQYIEWRDPKDNNKIIVRFPSTDAVLECISIDPDNAWSSDPWKEYAEDVDSWAGAHSMPAARDQYQYGWERLAEEMALGNPAHTVNRAVENEFDVVRDTSGGCVDMGAFVSGVPENMLNFVMHERSRRTISILYNVCASGSTDKDSLIMRGMKVASICDYFEKCGYRVRIDVCDTASGYNNGAGSAWNLVFCAKDYGQSLDFGRIGFMMGSPAMLRRIFFGVEASSRLWRNTIGKTFGCVCPVFTHLGNQYDYVFDYNSPINSQSPDQVVEYILTGIANQKVDMSLIGGGA